MDSVVLIIGAHDRGTPQQDSTDVALTITITNNDNQLPPEWDEYGGGPLEDYEHERSEVMESTPVIIGAFHATHPGKL